MTTAGEILFEVQMISFGGDEKIDCATATAGEILFDESENVFKVCQDNILMTIDTSDYTQKLIESLENGGDWITGEFPAFIQEVLTYYRAVNTLGALFSCGLFALGVWLLIKATRYSQKEAYDVDGEFLYLIGGIIAGSFGLIATIISGAVALQVWLAPRVFLVEWLGGLL